MDRYRYKAFGENIPPFEGVLFAPDAAAAALQLRGRGLTVMRLRRDRGSRLARRPFRKRRTLSLFCREWAALLDAGIPVAEAFGILSSSCGSRAADVLSGISETVAAGHTLTEAFRESGAFPPFFTAMLSVGEAGGTLPDELRRLAAYYDKEAHFRKKLIGAAGYPLFLLCFSLGVFLLILTVILPSFAALFRTLGIPLPALTAGALAFGNFLRAYGLLLLAALLLAGAGLALFLRTERGKELRDAVLLRSVFLRRLVLIRICHTLAALLSGGATLSDALLHAAEVAGNRSARDAFAGVLASIRRGRSFPESLAASGASLPVLDQMAAAGAESGELPRFLAQAAALMTEETEEALSRLAAVLSPALILFVGALIGLVVCTVMIPIFEAIGRGL